MPRHDGWLSVSQLPFSSLRQQIAVKKRKTLIEIKIIWTTCLWIKACFPELLLRFRVTDLIQGKHQPVNEGFPWSTVETHIKESNLVH